MKKFAFVLFATLIFSMNIAFAAESTTEENAGAEVSDYKLDKDAPDAYLVEAREYAEMCRKDDTLPLYFNCECMAAQYLGIRKKLGAEAPPSLVKVYLGTECKDASGAAIATKEKCLEDGMFTPKGIDKDVFCNCYGYGFARLFEQLKGAMSARAEIALRSRAQTECKDPDAARRLYGSR